MSKTPYQIPFVTNTFQGKTVTSMCEYVGWRKEDYTWRDNYVFTARLELVGHYRGRSAARVNVRNADNGEEYSMGFGAFYDAVSKAQEGDLANGILWGKWTFKKQGSNYGLVPVFD